MTMTNLQSILEMCLKKKKKTKQDIVMLWIALTEVNTN
jgi:hypothetical protein